MRTAAVHISIDWWRKHGHHINQNTKRCVLDNMVSMLPLPTLAYKSVQSHPYRFICIEMR